jgi:hypothetical protein
MSDADVAAYVERVSSEIPAGRVGSAEDIGDALVFLASDASSYIRGIDLIVDGRHDPRLRGQELTGGIALGLLDGLPQPTLATERPEHEKQEVRGTSHRL